MLSSETCRIVGSNLCTLLDDLEALRLAKKDLDCSRPCFEPSLGEDGMEGSDVNTGDDGVSLSSGDSRVVPCG